MNDCDAYIKDGQFWIYVVTYNKDSYMINYNTMECTKCQADYYFMAPEEMQAEAPLNTCMVINNIVSSKDIGP